MAIQFEYFFFPDKKGKMANVIFETLYRLSLVRLVLMYILHLGFVQPETNIFCFVLFVCLFFFFFLFLFCFCLV